MDAGEREEIGDARRKQGQEKRSHCSEMESQKVENEADDISERTDGAKKGWVDTRKERQMEVGTDRRTIRRADRQTDKPTNRNFLAKMLEPQLRIIKGRKIEEKQEVVRHGLGKSQFLSVLSFIKNSLWRKYFTTPTNSSAQIDSVEKRGKTLFTQMLTEREIPIL